MSSRFTVHRRPGVGLLLLALALVPLTGISWFTVGEIRDASGASDTAAQIQASSQRLTALVESRAALTDDRIWTFASMGISDLGVPLSLVHELVDIDLVAELDEARARVEDVLAPDDSDYLATVAELHDASAVPGADPMTVNSGFVELDDRLRADLAAELDHLGELAALQADGDELVRRARVLQLASELNESANQELSAYFGLLFPVTDDPLVEVRRLIDAAARYDTGAERLSQLIDDDGAAGARWESITSDPDVSGFAARIDQAVDESLLEGIGDDGIQPLTEGLASDLGDTAAAFLLARHTTDAHLELVTAAAGDVSDTAADHRSSAADQERTALVTALSVTLLSLLAALLAARTIVRPLRKMGSVSVALRDGVLDQPVEEAGPREVRSAARALNEAVGHLRLAERQATALAEERLDDPVLDERAPGRLGSSLQRAVEHLATTLVEREEFRRRLAHEAAHDGLTGLPNRSASLAHLARALARTRRSGTEVAVMFIDLDGFKRANDLHGHPVGDRLLKLVSQRLVTTVREGDLVGRLGGDEFLVVAEPVTSAVEAIGLAERLRAAVAEPTNLEGVDWTPSASIGVAMGGTELTADELLRDADLAVYQAKARGGAGVELCNAELRTQLVARADLETALRHAIELGELRLHYQSTVDARTGRITGLEALVRWDRPGHGLQPPDNFIPVAERSDLIVSVDRWVIRDACRQLAEWHDHPVLGTTPVAVNVSGRHLALDSFVGDVLGPLADHGVDPRRLVVEVTESALLADLSRAAANLEALRRCGVRVAIDDFGTGYTSLAHLRSLPVDILKIDRSFTARLTDANERSLVKLIVDTGHLLGVSITVEGVETTEQAELLTQLGSDTLQGYRFSRPQPATELVALSAGVAAT